MKQSERRLFLINELLRERSQDETFDMPTHAQEQKQLLRSLFNIRMPQATNNEFLAIQDAYLQTEIAKKGITDIADLTPIQKELYLWQGDITTLRCDGIVNAANSQMLGCFYPCHGCIDNAIHTFAGVQLRTACWDIMKKQGHEEAIGLAKITSAYNLPCSYVLHTVGPMIQGEVTKKDEEQLASCYRSCLQLADENNLKHIAFCCISTGEFHFPNERAAAIAVATVKEYKRQTQSKIEVVFNVFKQNDYEIYQALLG